MSDTISRQAVLKLLTAMPPEEAMTKALLIQSVKQMSAAQPYTDEEIKKIQELEQAQFEKMYELGYQAGRMAQPERKRGKWIDDGDPFMWKCGCCGYRVKRYNNTRYCPNCGADMREVSE